MVSNSCLLGVIRDRIEPTANSAISAMEPKAEVNSEHWRLCMRRFKLRNGSLQSCATNSTTLNRPQAGSTPVAVQRRVVVQHQCQLMQLLVAKALLFDRFDGCQHVVAIVSGA